MFTIVPLPTKKFRPQSVEAGSFSARTRSFSFNLIICWQHIESFDQSISLLSNFNQSSLIASCAPIGSLDLKTDKNVPEGFRPWTPRLARRRPLQDNTSSGIL